MGNITAPIYRYPCKHCQKQSPVKVGIFYSWFQLHSIKQPWFKCKCTDCHVLVLCQNIKWTFCHSKKEPKTQYCVSTVSHSAVVQCIQDAVMLDSNGADRGGRWALRLLRGEPRVLLKHQPVRTSAVKRSTGFTISWLKAPSRDFTFKTLLIIFANKLVRP